MNKFNKWVESLFSGLLSASGTGFNCSSSQRTFEEATAPLSSHALLAITYNCVAACPHCYLLQQDSTVFNGRQVMDEILFSKILESPSFRGIKKVTFAGGEALLHPDIFNWINVIGSRGIKSIASITNGILLQNDRIVDRLIETKLLTQFNVSLDADNKEEYCRVKGIKNADFEKILNSIKTLASHFKGTDTRVSGSFVLYNMSKHDVRRILLFGQSLGFHKITIHALHMVSGDDDSNGSVPSMFKKISESIMSNTDYEVDVTVKIPVSVADRTYYCPSLANYMCIGADGLMAPCCHVPWSSEFGSFNASVQNVINYPAILAMREKFISAREKSDESLLPDACQHCPKRTKGSLNFNLSSKKWTWG